MFLTLACLSWIRPCSRPVQLCHAGMAVDDSAAASSKLILDQQYPCQEASEHHIIHIIASICEDSVHMTLTVHGSDTACQACNLLASPV